MYIYADILIIVNIYIDYLLITAVRCITNTKIRTIRGIAAAFVGSLFSLLIFVPSIPAPLLLFIDIISSALIIYTAFGYSDKASFFKRVFIFLISSLILGGTGNLISEITCRKVILSRNGVIYADFSPAALIISSVIAYGAIAVYSHISSRAACSGSYTLIIKDGCGITSIPASADTGNSLKDFFSGRPVIVCPRKMLDGIFRDIPEEDLYSLSSGGTALKLRWRFIPFRTASGQSLIPVIVPEELCIKDNSSGKIYSPDVCIGAAPTDMQTAVFDPRVLF